MLRWGLWMAPIINSFLRQSPEPDWFNQDGAVRSLVAIGADVGMSHDRFADFSLTMFMGLLAYDWLRILIWFDHMGLRVATLVNLSFVGGDRLDEAAGRFLGHGARTRAIPERHPPFRHLGAAAHSLLHPARRQLGQGVDRRRSLWRAAARRPARSKTLAVAYGVAGVAAALGALVLAARLRDRRSQADARRWRCPARRRR